MTAACASLVLTPWLRRFCERHKLVDEPSDDRRVHRTAVPRLGGIAIFISILISLSGLALLNNLLTQTLRPDLKHILAFLLCGFLVLLLGIYDDLRGANATVKFVGLAAVTALFYALGGRIEHLSIPFVGGVNLPTAVGFLLTMIWVVGIANAFNLIDGVDGLATGSALFSSLVLLTVSLLQGKAMVAVCALVLTGALAGFLRYNFNPASIFLGDSGSLFVGFSLAALSILGAEKASTTVAVAIPILAFGLPVVDTGVAIARRFLSGKPIFQGDREHIHHMLLRRGWSQRRVALVLYGVSAAFGLLAMVFVNSGSSLTAVVLFVVGVAVVIALGNLRYHEVDELRASVRRNIGERRARATNNLRVRRASQAVASAASLPELFEGVLEVLELGGFVYATVELNCNGHSDLSGRISEMAAENDSRKQVSVHDGRIQWTWKRVDFENTDVLGSDRFWTLRLPLAGSDATLGCVNLYRPFDFEELLFDVNYLTTVFQPALAHAAQRIFVNGAAPARQKFSAAAG